MERIIFCDIDKTLINPSISLNNFENGLVGVNNVKKGDILGIYHGYIEKLESSTDFEPNEFIESVSKRINLSFEYLTQSFYNPSIWENAIYPETKEVLERLNDEETILGIFSEGNIHYQTKKLELVGIRGYFNEEFIIVERRKQCDDCIEKLLDWSHIVDDKKEVISKLKTVGKFNPFWVNRNDEIIEMNVPTGRNLYAFADIFERRA